MRAEHEHLLVEHRQLLVEQASLRERVAELEARLGQNSSRPHGQPAAAGADLHGRGRPPQAGPGVGDPPYSGANRAWVPRARRSWRYGASTRNGECSISGTPAACSLLI